MKRVKVGIIGAGWITNAYHLPCLAEIKGAELAALAEVDGKKLTETAAKYKIKNTFSDYKQMLKEAELDAVYVTTRPAELKKIAIDCFEAKKAVFLEKPPGVNLKECREMLNSAKKNKCLHLVGFNRRYAPIILKAREILAANGGVTQVVGEFHKNLSAQGEYYGISLLLSDIIHILDIISWIGGKPKKVMSLTEKIGTDWKSGFNALIKFKSGITGNLLSNFVSGARYERFELHGKEIMVEVMPPDYLKIYKGGKVELVNAEALTGTKEPRVNYGFFAENKTFIDCVLKKKAPEHTLKDALLTMELIKMIEKN